jgi:uncharacterized membrane protein
MKNCVNCGAAIEENAAFCTACGAPVAQTAKAEAAPVAPVAAPVKDALDHTDEFSAEDVAENKLIVALAYVLPVTVGAILCIWLSKVSDSAYLKFHSREILKLAICSLVVTMVCAVTSFLVIPAIALGAASVAVVVLRVIGFIQAIKSQSKELPVICNISLLK